MCVRYASKVSVRRRLPSRVDGGMESPMTNSATADPPPLLPGASREQTLAILGAMRTVAETGGPASQDDMLALESTDRYMFGHRPPVAPADIQPVNPAALAAALGGSNLAQSAVKFITVMAFVDGKL